MAQRSLQGHQQAKMVKAFLEQHGGEPGFRPEDIPVQPASGRWILLAVYLPDRDGEPGWLRTLRDWWQFICSQRSGNRLHSSFTFDIGHLRLAPGVTYEPGIRWVEYQPNAYRGVSPEQALNLAKRDDVQVAGAETIMAALQLNSYVDLWLGPAVAPYLSAYQYSREDSELAWSHVPELIPDRFGLEVALIAAHVTSTDSRLGSPAVRKL